MRTISLTNMTYRYKDLISQLLVYYLVNTVYEIVTKQLKINELNALSVRSLWRQELRSGINYEKLMHVHCSLRLYLELMTHLVLYCPVAFLVVLNGM